MGTHETGTYSRVNSLIEDEETRGKRVDDIGTEKRKKRRTDQDIDKCECDVQKCSLRATNTAK